MSLVFATTFFFFFFLFGGGGGGGVLRHSAVQTDFEFEISGPLLLTLYILGILHAFLSSAKFFSKLNFSKKKLIQEYH